MECPFCNFKSTTYDDFTIHLLMTKEKSHEDLLKLLFNEINELIENGNIFEIVQQTVSQTQIEDNQIRETDSQKMKIKKSKSKTRLKCPYCDYITTWHRNLYHHITIKHLDNILKNNQETKSQVENIDYNKCPYCGQEFTKISELKNHIKNVHLLDNYICPFCKIKFESPLLLIAHLWNSNDGNHRYLHSLITKD
jgi:Zn finger protein HypA/HybF involved in hydrogenase expression